AMQVISRVRQLLPVQGSLQQLMMNPTIAAMAENIEEELHSCQGQQIIPIQRVQQREHLPVSFAQQRLFFLQQMEPESWQYNASLKVRLSGALNVSALERAIAEIVRRHEVLRTTFDLVDGELEQKINPAAQSKLTLINLERMAEVELQKVLQDITDEQVREP